jgi:hypothetical protein
MKGHGLDSCGSGQGLVVGSGECSFEPLCSQDAGSFVTG